MTRNILVTTRDRGLASMGHLQGTTHRGSYVSK